MPNRTVLPRLVVTGATGRIGRLLQAAWSATPLTGVDPIWCARSWGPWQDLLAGPLDPAPRDAVILHLAADLGDAPGAAARSIAMARAVATAARQGRARHVLFASSAAVYGPCDGDLEESAPCMPASAYGQRKYAAEQACCEAAGNLPVTALRIGNVIGAGALLGRFSALGDIVLDPVPGQVGGPIRSWIAPGELGRVIGQLVAVARGQAGLPHVLNLASPGAHAMAALLDAAGLPWRFGAPRAEVTARVTLDTARLQSLCPMEPLSPDEMIADWRRTLAHRITA